MRYLTLLFAMMLQFSTTAQHEQCITDAPALAPLIRQYLSQEIAAPRTDQYVPLSFRIIADDNGISHVTFQDIYDAVCVTNTLFEGSGIQFYVLGIDYPFQGDFFLDEPFGNPELIELIEDPRSLDIFVADFTWSLNLFSGYGSSTSLEFDVIMMKDNFLHGTSFSLAHQLGHFFKLIHPFNGWVGIPDQITNYFDPNGMLPAVDTLPTGFPTELADGSNCHEVGDLLCDTPPDYLFGSVFNGCPQNLTILDANSDTLPWMPGNVMGSFLDCEIDSYYFSPLQQQVMLADFLSPSRDYLRELPQPSPGTVTQDVALISPIDGNIIMDYTFEWEAAGENLTYLVEVSRVPSFLFLNNYYLTNETQLTIAHDELEPDDYYWRVRPLGPGLDCNLASSPSSAFTVPPLDLNTSENRLEIDWNVHPNPVFEDINLSLELLEKRKLEISISDLQGQRIFSHRRNFLSGFHLFTIPKRGLSAGTYLLTIREGAKTSSKRLLVL